MSDQAITKGQNIREDEPSDSSQQSKSKNDRKGPFEDLSLEEIKGSSTLVRMG